MSSYYELMQTQEPYVCRHFDMPHEKGTKARMLVQALEAAPFDDRDEKMRICQELFGTSHPGACPGSGFKCDYGFNIHFHGFAVINYNVVMLDTSPINIGAGAFIGPNCVLACSGHSMVASQRLQGICPSAPITLEDNVWLGANVTVVAGVTIGEGSVIGAGSVVTKDIPAGVLAAGNPCRVIREITEEDMLVPTL